MSSTQVCAREIGTQATRTGAARGRAGARVRVSAARARPGAALRTRGELGFFFVPSTSFHPYPEGNSHLFPGSDVAASHHAVVVARLAHDRVPRHSTAHADTGPAERAQQLKVCSGGRFVAICWRGCSTDDVRSTWCSGRRARRGLRKCSLCTPRRCNLGQSSIWSACASQSPNSDCKDSHVLEAVHVTRALFAGGHGSYQRVGARHAAARRFCSGAGGAYRPARVRLSSSERLVADH